MVDVRVIFGRGAFAAAGIAGALLLSCEGTAQAQFFGWWNTPPAYGSAREAPISPAEIYRIVAAGGYQISGGLRRNGRVYLVDVIDSWGRPLRLVVDAYEGNIVQRFATAPPRPAASIPPRSQSYADLAPRYPPGAGYPPFPGYANPPPPPTAQREFVPPPPAHPASSQTRRKPSHKTQTATRESGSARTVRHPAGAEIVPQQPAAKIEPGHAGPPAGAKPDSPTAAQAQSAPRTEPTPAPAKPTVTRPAQQKTDGPGYANGVPINPLD